MHQLDVLRRVDRHRAGVLELGGESGSIYRFITWVDDPCDTNNPTYCAGTADYKRVTVMVTQNNPDGPQKPLLISELVSDPTP